MCFRQRNYSERDYTKCIANVLTANISTRIANVLTRSSNTLKNGLTLELKLYLLIYIFYVSLRTEVSRGLWGIVANGKV